MKPAYQEYQARKILNVHKHVDGWFFDKYSAHPYVGCAFGCEFCYSREDKYRAGRDPDEIPSTREKRYLASGHPVWRLRLVRPGG